MAKFNKDKVLDIIRDGSDAEQEALVEELEKMLDTKKYGLVWERGGTSEDSPFEAEDVVLQMSSGIPYPIHREDLSLANKREREREREPLNGRNNLLLEGDNYIWLKILEQTHRGKIDVIYIDPPYNTGKKDFKYNDKFVDPNDTFRHSKWIDFMYKRLLIAHQLLSNDGIVFISCDDNEYAVLKMLCDEVFQQQNFVNTFHWVSNLKGRQLDGHGAAGTTEYVLCYAKNKDVVDNFYYSAEYLRKQMPEVYQASYDSFEDEWGPFVIKNELYNTNSQFNEETRPNLVYDIYYNPNTKDVITENVNDEHTHQEDGYVKISPHPNADGKHKYHAFRWSRKKVQEETNDLYFIEKNGKWRVYTKVRGENQFQLKDLIMGISTKAGSDALKTLGFPSGTFTAPKPPMLLKLLLGAIDNQELTVLDFFAGSGTTAHAIEELNAEDGGHRQWILITNNEDQDKDDGDPETGICRDITKPRIDAVITGKCPDGTVWGAGTDSAYDYYQYDFLDRAEHRNQNETRFRKTKALAPLVAIKYGARKIDTIIEHKALVYDSGKELIILSVGTPTIQDITDIAQAQELEERRIVAVVPDESPIALEEIVEGITVVPFSRMTDRGYLGERK